MQSADANAALNNLTNQAAVTGLVLASTATNGFQLYNTADQTTNFQRLVLKYSSGIALIGTDTGTTAAGTPLQLYSQLLNNGAFFSRLDLSVAAGATILRQGCYSTATGTGLGGLSTATNPFISFGNLLSSSTSGTNVVFAVTPTYNQSSGTAANTDLLINRTQTAVGSGAQLLWDGQVGGVSVASLGSTIYGALPSGATTNGTAFTQKATTFTVTGTNTATAFQANYFGAPTFTNASAGLITDAFNTIFAGPAAVAGSQQASTRSHTVGIVDSTSASSSITGGLVVAATLGTSATSVGIGGGNINAGGTIISGGNMTVGAKVTSYNGITTAGLGVPVTVASANITAQSAAATITSFATAAADSDFEVMCQLNASAATSLSAPFQCTYTDVNNVAKTLTFAVQDVDGTAGTFLANGLMVAAAAKTFMTPTMHIRVKASTTITLKVGTGTFTAVTYSASGVIRQLN